MPNFMANLKNPSCAVAARKKLYSNTSDVCSKALRNHDTYNEVARVLIICFILFMISTSLQLLLGDIPLSRILGAATALVLFVHLLIERLSNARVLAICVFGMAAMRGIAISTEVTEEFEFWIYLAVALLLLDFVSSDRGVEALKTAAHGFRGMIRLAVMILAVLVAFLLVSGIGYSASWGNERFFRGWCSNEHTMASVCCLAIAFAALANEGKTGCRLETLFEYSVFSVALFQTGARVFLVPLAILWLFHIHGNVSQKWLKVVIAFLCLIGAVMLFSFGGMALKLDALDFFADGQSAVSVFTSGRSDFWLLDLEQYLSSGPLGIFLGNSASSVYDINQSVFGTRIWAHNDVIMSICSAGILTVAVYVSGLWCFFRYYCSRSNRAMTVLIIMYVAFPALINGFFQYQHFVYSAALLTCATLRIDDRFEEKNGGADYV